MQPVHYINLTLSLCLGLVLYAAVRRSRYPFYAPSNLFLVFYWLVVPGGAILAWVYELFVGEYNSTPSEILSASLVAWVGLLAYYIGMSSGGLVYGRKRFRVFPATDHRTKRLVAILMLAASLSAMVIYVSTASNQVSGDSYSLRFSENLGKGYLTLFFFYYIPAILLLFMLRPSRRRWLLFTLLIVCIGLFNFVAIGGARRGLFIGIFAMLLAGHMTGILRLTLTKVVVGGIAMIAGLTMLALVRYGVNVSDFSSVERHHLAHLIIDSIAPIDSLVKAMLYIQETDAVQGIDLFLNQFVAVIPRTVWLDKPELILNSGNFFTQEVLRYPVEGLTISPTLLGALILAGGWGGVVAGMIATGFLLNWLNLQLINSNYVARVFLVSNAVSFFGLAREGLEVLIYKLLLDYILFVMFLLVGLVLAKVFQNATRPIPARA